MGWTICGTAVSSNKQPKVGGPTDLEQLRRFGYDGRRVVLKQTSDLQNMISNGLVVDLVRHVLLALEVEKRVFHLASDSGTLPN